MTKKGSFKKKTTTNTYKKEGNCKDSSETTNQYSHGADTQLCKILVITDRGIFRNKFTASVDSLEI
jgi:hypothetical protein